MNPKRDTNGTKKNSGPVRVRCTGLKSKRAMREKMSGSQNRCGTRGGETVGASLTGIGRSGGDESHKGGSSASTQHFQEVVSDPGCTGGGESKAEMVWWSSAVHHRVNPFLPTMPPSHIPKPHFWKVEVEKPSKSILFSLKERLLREKPMPFLETRPIK